LPDASAVAPQFVDREQQRESARLGMWVFLMTEVMFFGSLFLAYFYYHRLFPEAFASAGGRTELWLGAGNTAVLLVSKGSSTSATSKTIFCPERRSPTRPRRWRVPPRCSFTCISP
jgi:cytochrome c oxidase subunit 3